MIIVDWGNFEETFLVFRIRNKWTCAEFQVAVQEAFDLIAGKSEPIGMIVDLQAADRPPHNLMNHAFRYVNACPLNLGPVAVLSRSDLWRRIWETGAMIYGTNDVNIHFVTSLDQAYTLMENKSPIA